MKSHATPPDHHDAEWQAQERARLAVRAGVVDADADADDLRVARALRLAPPVGLPNDFAARMAGLARGQAADSSLFEQRLLRGLSVLFAVSALVTVAWYGRSWPAELAAALPGGNEAAGWSVVAGACVIGNWAFALLRRRLVPGDDTPA